MTMMTMMTTTSTDSKFVTILFASNPNIRSIILEVLLISRSINHQCGLIILVRQQRATTTHSQQNGQLATRLIWKFRKIAIICLIISLT